MAYQSAADFLFAHPAAMLWTLFVVVVVGVIAAILSNPPITAFLNFCAREETTFSFAEPSAPGH
jgi:hypothetical protein